MISKTLSETWRVESSWETLKHLEKGY
jgi:hypothetical protein